MPNRAAAPSSSPGGTPPQGANLEGVLNASISLQGSNRRAYIHGQKKIVEKKKFAVLLSGSFLLFSFPFFHRSTLQLFCTYLDTRAAMQCKARAIKIALGREKGYILLSALRSLVVRSGTPLSRMSSGGDSPAQGMYSKQGLTVVVGEMMRPVERRPLVTRR